jgi:hypothetical protein
MRPIQHGDVTCLARYLLTLPAAERRVAAGRLLDRVEAADLYRKRLGRLHPVWGNGSVMGAVLMSCRLPPEPAPGEPRYLSAMAEALAALLAHHVPKWDGSRS